MDAFNIPSTVIMGGGASGQIVPQMQRLAVANALIVTDAWMVSSGSLERIIAPLREVGMVAAVFSGVQPDPTVANVLAGLALYRESGAQSIVAIGGGSSLDAGKAISLLTTNPEPLSQYMGYHRVARAGAPLIAVPTTAGTGSEVTKVAVITDAERNIKMMMLDAHLLPAVALVDYELTLSMPSSLTAHVGVDTLTHGIEAFVSRKASPTTNALALSCISLVAQHLTSAWEQPHDAIAREGMMLAACHGGMAFANSSVCLVHGMSRPLGAMFHIPHGLSNAMLLPAVTRFSIEAAPARYAMVAQAMKTSLSGETDSDAAQSLVRELETLNAHLNVPRVRDFPGMEWEHFQSVLPKMAQDALASGSPQNNPRIPTEEDIVQLYELAW